MKGFIALFIFSTLSGQLLAQEQSLLSPAFGDLDHPNDERLIEPTSPILGKNLVAKLKEDKRHPEIILSELYEKHPTRINELQVSSIAYFKTLVKPLDAYCSTEQKEEPNDKRIGVVEHAAIPLHVLTPMHDVYIRNLLSLRQNYVEKVDPNIEEIARETAQDYQQHRYGCNVVIKLNEMEAKVKKYLPKRLDRLVELHHKISSAEAAFPRVQFSINGFTQYVFDEILKIEYNRLAGLLKIAYDSQTDWLAKRSSGVVSERFMSAFENKALDLGYLPKEILLIIAYSTRNMPSLDVQYGYDTRKALLLETYFWKLHAYRDLVTSKYLDDIFPNAVMKRNPGIYHYATSALLACEVKLHGYTGAMARIVALGNKIGYKVHKLLGELAGKEGKKSLKEIKETAKVQGFGPGVDAGKYGGSHGLKFCRKYTPKSSWAKKDRDFSNGLPEEHELSILDQEDLSEELEEIF